MSKLSDRVRPNSECAPWVADEIKRLEQQNAELQAKVDELAALLNVVVCPDCNGSGAYYDNMGGVCQCQWCYERAKAQ